MILISHRGNIDGKFESYENEPNYIDSTIRNGYDVEVDVWYVEGVLYLGHDEPQYGVDFEWFKQRLAKLWIHCKNIQALLYFKDCGHDAHYFWHEEDTVTLTSKGYVWAYPGKQPIKNSIAVMPEAEGDDIEHCLGVCSDFIQNYRK